MIIVDPVCQFSSIYRICTFLIFFIILLIGVIGTAKSQPCAKSCLVLNIRVPSYGKIKEKWHTDPRGWAYKRGLVSSYVILNKSISFNKVYWENRARIAWLSLSYILGISFNANISPPLLQLSIPAIPGDVNGGEESSSSWYGPHLNIGLSPLST